MSDLATIGFRAVTGSLDAARRKLNSLASTGERVESRVSGSMGNVSSSFKTLAGVVGSTVAAVAGLSKLTDITREFDVLNAQLITATGSAENANVAFKAIQNFAATTPFDLAQATNGFTQLVNLGLTPSEAALTSYGNTASAMGRDLSQMIEAVADASVGEFERLKEFGIKSKSEGDNVTFTFRGVSKTIKKEADAIEGYLIDLGKNEFAGAMSERAKTLDGAISNLSDTWDSLFLTISKQGIGDFIQKGVLIASNSLQTLDDLISSGIIANSINAIIGRVSVFADDARKSFSIVSSAIFNLAVDFNDSLNVMVAVLGTSTGAWWESIQNFLGNALNGFKQLPEMVRFFSQVAGTKFGLMVDLGKIHAQAFVDIFKLKFKELVEVAKLDGMAIANALNPFSDEFDYTGKLASIRSVFEAESEKITKSANSRANALSNMSDELIDGYALESIAIKDNFDLQINQNNTLIESHKKSKKSQGDALDKFKTGAEDVNSTVKNLKNDVDNADIFGGITDSAVDALSSIKSLSKHGSSSYKALGVGIKAVTAAQKVSAAVSAATMATVTGGITAVLGLVSALGSLGGELETTFEFNQENQGLNIWGEKAESIANGIDTIASSTGDLVGINTGMLEALNAMQAGISSAAIVAGREGSNVEFEDIHIARAVTEFLGGKSKIADEGVQILGGTIADLIDGATVEAFQEIKKKRTFLSKTKTTEVTKQLDETSKEFGIVFGNLADSVQQGAVNLGLNADDVKDSINKFNLETTKISLMHLSPEERQAEIESVFSQIFDNLSESVIPFAVEFQKAGEGMGETLSRLSAQVSVTDILVNDLGVNIADKMANPLLYAGIADNLTRLTGGIEQFAEKVSSFVDDFAPESVRFNMASSSLTKSLSDVGLEVPKTSEAFFNLLQSAQTDEQIAAILNSQGVAKDYYKFIEKQENDRRNEIESFNSSLLSLSKSLRGTARGLFGVSSAAANMSLNSAISAARMGDFSKAMSLDVSNIGADKSSFGSLTDFNIAQAETASKLVELAELTEGQASIEDMMLTESKTQTELLTSINNSYTPQQNIDNSNVIMIEEIKSLKNEIRESNNHQSKTAESTKKSAELLQRIEVGGVEIRA